MPENEGKTQEPVKIDTKDARGGRPGKPVLYVLIGALVLIVIGLFIAFGTAS